MSTEETTNTQLSELIAIDPTFAEKEAEVRVLLRELGAKKPVVIIDETFMKELRARLIGTHVFPIRSPYMKLNWWAVHLAPIGAIAILLLVLMPERLHYLENQTTDTGSEERNSEMRMEMSEDSFFTSDPPHAKSVPQSDEAESTVLFNTMGQGGDAQALPSDRFTLTLQNPGVSITIESVTLTRPGYVAIHSFSEEGIGPVIGISPIQNSGTTVGVPIYLRHVTYRGETYYAGLYHDNGNGVFSISDDAPVIDPSTGTPTGAVFTIGVSEVR